MKISVAMTTYNGEKYIKEQLDSIVNQTLPVDEIIISDDGSIDSTVEIVLSYKDERICLLRDNPYLGYAGNFQWAIEHTTGDIIFLADQDDVWFENKVEKTLEVFRKEPQIKLVMTDGILIDKEGKCLEGKFNHYLQGCSGLIEKNRYLDMSIWVALANGMCMSFTKDLKKEMLPFPESSAYHDRWIAFCVLCSQSGYYLNEKLVGYRIHDTNTSIRGRLSVRQRVERVLNTAYNEPYDLFNMSVAMVEKLTEMKSECGSAISAAKELMGLSYNQIDIIQEVPILSGYKLLQLYFNNSLYRKNGVKYFIAQLSLVLFKRKYMEKNKRVLNKGIMVN